MKKRRTALLAVLLALSMTVTMGSGTASIKADEASSQTTVVETTTPETTTDTTAPETTVDTTAPETTVETTTPETTTAEKKTTTITITTTTYQALTGIYARTEPSTRSNNTKAFIISTGTTITSTETVDDLVLGSSRKWAKFTKDGKTYYVSTNSQYMKVVKTTTTEIETEVAESETTTQSEVKESETTTQTQVTESESTTPTETPSESETTTESEQKEDTSKQYKVTTALNVRSGAGTSYSKLGTLAEGTVITVTETATVDGKTWGKFNYNGQDGWVSLAYCTAVASGSTTGTTTESTESTTTTSTKYQITASSLNIRKGPGTSYETVGSIGYGEVVTVTETTTVDGKTWGKTTYNGVTGWISLAYATTNIDTTTTTTTSGGGWKSVSGTWTYYDSTGTKKFASNTMHAAWSKIASKSSSTGYYICVNCSSCQTFIFKGSSNNWVPYKLWSCTPGASSTPTVKGTYSIIGKGYSFGKTNQYTCYYYSQFYGNYLFHSVLYYYNSKTIKSGTLGVQASHGCVRLAIENAKWIYDTIPYGTPVYTY